MAAQDPLCQAKVQIAYTAAPGYVLAGFTAPPPWLTVLTSSASIRGAINAGGDPIILDERIAIFDDVTNRPVRLTDAMLERYMQAVPNGRPDLVEGRVVTDAMAREEERYMRTHREFTVGNDVDVVSGPFRDHRVKVLGIEGRMATIELDAFGTKRQVAHQPALPSTRRPARTTGWTAAKSAAKRTCRCAMALPTAQSNLMPVAMLGRGDGQKSIDQAIADIVDQCIKAHPLAGHNGGSPLRDGE